MRAPGRKPSYYKPVVRKYYELTVRTNHGTTRQRGYKGRDAGEAINNAMNRRDTISVTDFKEVSLERYQMLVEIDKNKYSHRQLKR